MKQKMYIGAITVVIAGLMITSAMGMNNIGTQKKTANENKAADMTTILQQIKENPSALLNLEKCTAVNKVTDTPQMQKGSVHGSPTKLATVQSQTLIMQSKHFQSGRGTTTQILTQHPALASSPDGSKLILGYECCFIDYENPSNSFCGLVWQGSCDYGYTWSDPVYFVKPDGTPIQYSYPVVDYWGKNGTKDIFYGACQADPTYHNGAEMVLIRFEYSSPCNLEMYPFVWEFDFSGIKRFEKPSLDCENTRGDWFPGYIPFIFSVSPGYQKYPGIFLIENESGWAEFWWFGSNYTQCVATDSSVDYAGLYCYAVWDTKVIDEPGNPPGNYDLLLVKLLRSTPELDLKTYYFPQSHLGIRYPAVAAYNNHVIVVYQIENSSDPNFNSLRASVFLDNDITKIDHNTSWMVNKTLYPTGGKLLYPEIAHVQGDTFILLYTLQIPGQPNKILIGVTKDGGFTWKGFFVWSGDDPVHAEYRNADLSDEASMTIWEYEVPGTYPDIYDRYIYNTYSIVGDVRHENGEAVFPDIVTITNTDPDWVPSIPSTITEPNHYASRAILGFDLYDNATIHVYAHVADGSEGSNEHMFLPGELDVEGQFIFWINVTVGGPLVSPDAPLQADDDGCHPRNCPGDENKGIGIKCINTPSLGGLVQTFTTSSANSGNEIYYKFYFGNGQNSGWLGPYSEGQIATTTYDYNQIGIFNVYATCKIGAAGTESAPSDITTVRMYYTGDINGDDHVNFGDINPFVFVLTNNGCGPYYTHYPNGYFWCADMNWDCVVDFRDINPFVTVLTGGCPPILP